MPFKWTPEAERAMLLTVVKQLDTKINPDVFEKVAEVLGEGVNANGCSFVLSYAQGFSYSANISSHRQKFYKLKRESEALYSGGGAAAPATPATGSSKKAAAKTKATSKSTAKATSAKRKSMSDDAVDEDVEDTPSKTKKAKVDVDDEDGEDED